MKKWNLSRLKEIQALQELLLQVSTINHGSHCLERIERCIKLAERLSKTNLNTGRSSFVRFLISKAHEGRKP